jgi:ABC-type transport system substrate-binding protein
MRLIHLRSTRSRFGDEKVRRAIAWAFDEQSLVDSGALALPVRYAAQVPSETAPGFIKDYAPLAYDLDKAKQAIADTGGPFSFELTYDTGSPADQAVALYAQQALKEIGVTVTVTPIDINQLETKYRAGELDAIVGAAGGQADPTIQMALIYRDQYAGLPPAELETFNTMLAEVNSQPLGSAERQAKLEELNRWTLEPAWAFPVYRQINVWAARDRIVGVGNMAWSFTGTTFDATYWAVKK